MARKFFLCFLVPTLGLLVAALAIVYFLIEAHLQKQVDDTLLATTESLNSAISARIESIHGDLTVIKAYRELTDYFHLRGLARFDRAGRALIELEDRFVAISGLKPTYRAIRFYDTEGRALIDVVEGKRNYRVVNASKAEWFRKTKALKPPSFRVSDTYRASEVGCPALTVSAPYLSREEVLGVLAVEVCVRDLVGDLIARRPAGESSYVYMVDSHGKVVAHSNDENVGRDVSSLRSTKRVLEGYKGVLSTLDQDGATWTRKGYLPQELANVGLVVAVPHGEIFEPIYRMRTTVVPVTIGGFLALMLIGVVMVRRTVRPIKRLTEVTGKVADGELDLMVRVETGDEIEELARSFNRMTRSLKSNRESIQRQNEELQSYRDHLQELVSEGTRELTAVNRELEAFCYSVSHDLRAPLRGIDGFSQILLEDYAATLDDEGKEFLRRLRASAQRMGTMIDDLLRLSLVTRGVVKRGPVDLSKLARDIKAHLETSRPDRVVRWVIAEELVAEGDEGLLREALENLLSNAWKFTERETEARIEFGMETAAGRRVYFVRDNGVGFDMQHVDKLFGTFDRLHGEDEFEGSGIGLAIVARIIDRHGGKTWAKGEPRGGATIYFTLSDASPVNPADEP